MPAEIQETIPVKTDPRIRRTRLHVLDVARQMLNEHKEALTFTAVAERAFVARQTLYKHWGTIENLIAETIVVARVGTVEDYDGLTARERARLFLSRITTEIDHGMAAAIASIIAASSYEPDSRAAFAKLDVSLYEMFAESVGPVTHDQFIELVSPVMFLTVARVPVSPTMIESLAERAEQFLPEQRTP